MTSNETIVENLRIIKRDQQQMYNRFAAIEAEIGVIKEALMDAVVDFKSYQLLRAKEALGNGKRSKKVSRK